jgi:GNAT superfamily N-acetyltransferase
VLRPDAADLAPGDAWAATLDWTALAVHRVRSPDDPRFTVAYDLLWREFGAQHEMEQRGVIESRLEWRPSQPIAGCALRYEMLVVERAGEIVALRDHTAILALDDATAPVVVHLSHALVLPAARRSGLGAWLRGLPLAGARDCAIAAGAPGRRIVLVAEMEPPEPPSEERLARLRIYGRAGFRCVDPARIDYHQPDFRPAAAIDASGLLPLPLSLIVRRVGREDEASLPASEVRAIVRALYAMYGAHQRDTDMAPLWARHAALPDGDQRIALLVP